MASLQERVAGHFWHHSIDLGQGIVTPGHKSPAVLAQEVARIFDPIDLTGRSVIDIGAWNGYFSFEAKRRGAARVLATDSFTWTHPDFRGRETFDLARKALNLEIEAREVDVMDLSPEIGQFDAALFLGVFYHLRDPIKGMEAAASVARDLMIVETHMDGLDLPKPAMVLFPGLAGDSTNWWGPNIHCVASMLRVLGFPLTYFQVHPTELGRGIFHGFRSAELAKRYVGARVPAWRDVSADSDAEAARWALIQMHDAAKKKPGVLQRWRQKILGA